MNEPSNHHQLIRQMLEAYALGALDADDAALVREHVVSCHECRAHFADLERAAATLPNALAAVGPHPPDGLKTQVLAAIAAGMVQENRDERAHLLDLEAAQEISSSGGGKPRPPSWFTVTAISRLAAAVVVILALAWSVRLAVALEQERALKAEFAALVSQQEVVLEVVDSDKTVRRVLLTTEPESCEPGTCSYGKLFTRTDLRHVVAMAARLPAPPPGQAYRLWLTGGGQTAPAGTLTLDDKGFGLLVFDADQSGPTYDRAELILQPGQSRSPDGEVVLLWTPSAAA